VTISFNLIPQGLRVPGIFVEFDNSQAQPGLGGQPRRILVLAQKLPAGTALADTLVRLTTADQAKLAGGEGSMLHHIFEALKRQNRFTETWAVPLDDNGAGAQAAGTITFGGAATAPGTLNLYVAGRRVQIAVASGDAAADVATKAAAAITAATALPVTAVVDGGTAEQVNVTARHAGELGNDIDLRFNRNAGEETPAGLTHTIVAMTGGTGNPDLASAIAALGDEWFHDWVLPYTDATSLTAVGAELLDRWGPTRPIDGYAYACRAGTHSALGTFGAGRNSPFVSVMGVEGSPTPPYEWAGALAGVVSAAANTDPARPYQTLALRGVLPPDEGSRFTLDERNLLLFDGISTFTVDADGTVRLERLITTYQTNDAGSEDTSYLNANRLHTLSFLRASFRTRFATKYPRHKLGSDGTRYGPGQAILTPKAAKAEAVALFREWEALALVENVDQFKADLVVERNADDPDRLDFLLPPDLVDQLRIVGAQISPRQ